MSLINLGCFCASMSHGCSSRRASSAETDIASSVATSTPSGLHDTCGAVNTMRSRLGFSLTMSRDEFHAGGRGVCRTRNEGERDSSKARGDGWLCGRGKNSMRNPTIATSYFILFSGGLAGFRRNEVCATYQACPTFDGMSQGSHSDRHTLVRPSTRTHN